MNELDIALATIDELHRQYSFEWDKVPARELAAVIRIQADFRKIMVEGYPEKGWDNFSVWEDREKIKLYRAARLAGYSAQMKDGKLVALRRRR
jgi:hypothetical protein